MGSFCCAVNSMRRAHLREVFSLLKRNIFLMYAISFFQGMVFYGSVATLYRQACGLTLFQITAIESIFSVVCIALEFPWGVIADRIGYRRTMLFCNLLFFISKIVFWKADTFGAFLCERLILSVVISGLSGVDDTVLFLSCGKQDAQRVFSIHGYFGTLGMVIASGCFSLFFSENFRAAAFWTVVAYALAALLSFGLKEVGAPKAQSLRKQLSSFRPAFLFQNQFIVFLLAMAVIQEVYQLMLVFLSQPLYLQAGWSTASMGAVHIALQLLSMSVLFSDSITKRWSARRFLLFLPALSALCSFLLAFRVPSAVLFAAIAAIQICCSLLGPLQTNVQNQSITDENRATALSVQSLFMRVIAIGINLIIGRISEISLSSALLACSALCFISLVCVVFWQRLPMYRRKK